MEETLSSSPLAKVIMAISSRNSSKNVGGGPLTRKKEKGYLTLYGRSLKIRITI